MADITYQPNGANQPSIPSNSAVKAEQVQMLQPSEAFGANMEVSELSAMCKRVNAHVDEMFRASDRNFAICVQADISPMGTALHVAAQGDYQPEEMQMLADQLTTDDLKSRTDSLNVQMYYSVNRAS